MSDTPETDNLARGNHVVPTEWAEQLERARDEARRYANDIDLCQGGVAPCDLAVKLMEKLDEAIRQRNETNESSKYAVEYARAQEDIHLQNSRKLVDLAERMLAEMEYVNWLSTAAVFRDELNQIKGEIK